MSECAGKKLSEYSDGQRGIWVFFHEKPRYRIPGWDKIQIVYESLNPENRKEIWIHEEEALSLISGLSQGVVEIMTRKSLRKRFAKDD